MTRVFDKVREWFWQWQKSQPEGLPPSALSLSDEELAWQGFEVARQALGRSSGSYKRKVSSLPPNWRFIYVMLKLDAEVKNGGFHQFFTNARGKYDTHLQEDIERIESPAFKGVISRALHLYQGIDYTDQWNNVGKSWERFAAAYKEGRFETEDKQYYSVEPGLDELIGRHLRQHFQEYQKAEPGASPNSGPAAPSANSGVTEGPPSVS